MIARSAAPSPAAGAARRRSEKAQIQDITERFQNYIQGVKSLRCQLKQTDAASAVQHLQNEVITIHNMYQQEVGSLREQLERSYRAQDGEGITTALVSEYQHRALIVSRACVTALRRYEDECSRRLTLEEEVMALAQQMEAQTCQHRQESQELRAQVGQSEARALRLEEQLRRGGPAMMETLQKLQQASEAEVRRLQDQSETAYSQSLLELQMRLHNDQMLLRRAQEDSERLQRRVEELTCEVTSLQRQLFSEASDKRTLLEKLEAERTGGRQHMEALGVRLEELQDLLLAKIKELNTFEETNVSLRNELDALNSMLEEEEQQMTGGSLHALHTPTSPSHLLAEPFQSPVFSPLSDYTNTSDLAPKLTPSRSSMVSSVPDASDHNISSEEGKPDLLEDEGQRSEPVMRPSTAPILSVIASDNSKRQCSLASMMENTADPEVLTSTSSMTGSGTKAAVSSALGDLEITEVHPEGHFVRITNRSLDKEEDIGSYLLQQNIRGHPVSIYRFPPKSRVFASCEVTVWASVAGVPHKPPTDFVWKEQNKFVTEPKCTTILCNPHGQALAWFTPLKDKTRKSLEKYEIVKSEPKTPLSEPAEVEATKDGRRRTPKSPPVYGKLEKVPRLLRREKIPAVVLPATCSPWAQSTGSPTHPDFSPDRLLLLGRDGNGLCRQTRSHTANAAPSADVLSTGQRNSKDPNGHRRRKNYRGPVRSAGPNSRGVLYLGYSSPPGSVLQKYLANSSYNIRLASHVSLAPTILSSV
ncbi:lamin tail domain-containing protein 1 isoform X2 [Eleutherodactylus coqui]|uniref:lamin tail domain-containing protein 1 isoform X2 n=1 Tax=Eleutherodactylus coqui TaxID=57060 RepID=UPI00346319D6